METGPCALTPGLIISGYNPLAVDIACVNLMGFDPARLPLYTFLLDSKSLFFVDAASDIRVKSKESELARCIEAPGRGLGFSPHANWRGFVEHERGM
ncbi:MAG TPA: hypothetical protein EYQ63_17520 [Fuerstia sp.]|nr:hypothetical protein [Fuerstiella sp.]